jgi:DNA-binding CsgD family transcriptional regulator
LGREAELDAIDQALADGRAQPAAVVISGEPGIGKTTVWRRGTELARARGYQVLSCSPTRSETRLSFSALADLMDPVPDRVLTALPAPQRDALETALLKRTESGAGVSHLALRMAVTGVLRAMAATGPVAVGVDDVQWLDPATARVLEFAFRRVTGLPVVAIVSTGSDQREALPLGLQHVLDGRQAVRVRLAPLSPPMLGRLLQADCGIALAKPDLLLVHGASGGNPRFAAEIAGELVRQGSRPAAGEPLPVPDGLARVVARRISALPQPEQAALLFAAALPDATIDQVRAAMDPGASGALDSAEEAGIIEVRDGRINFRRPFLAPIVYSSASPVRRRQIHGRLAEVVSDPEQRAWHMALAVSGPDAAVAEGLATAGRAAQARSATRAAARLWELSARRTPHSDPAGRRRRTVAAAACLLTAGDARRARTMAETVTVGLTPGRERAKLLLWLATITYCDDSPAEAVALCRQALGETGGDQALDAALHLRAAWFAEHDTSGRVRDAEAAVEILAGISDAPPDVTACALTARSYYRFLAGRGVAWRDLERARALLTRDGGSLEVECARFLLATMTSSFGEGIAREDLTVMYRRATELGYELAVPHVLTFLAELDCRMGEWPTAAAHAADAISAARQAGQQRASNMALSVKACLHAHVGEIDTARDEASRGLALATRAGDQWVAASHLAVLGFAAFSQRQLGTADRCLSTADALLSAMGLAEPASHRFHADHVEIVVARGDMARAATLVQRLDDRAQAAPLPWLRIAAARSRAILRAAEGDLDAAIDAVNEALSALEGTTMPFERGRTLLIAGQIRRRHKEKLLAAKALAAAKDIFEALGAPLWAAQADQELHRLGLRRNSRRNLTPSEERVARMVADGLTNREVASALFISHKTVEANLSRIFRKLGIQSRRELCAIESFT